MHSFIFKYKSSLGHTTHMRFFLLPGPPEDQILYNRTITLVDNAFGNGAYRYFLPNLGMSAYSPSTISPCSLQDQKSHCLARRGSVGCSRKTQRICSNRAIDLHPTPRMCGLHSFPRYHPPRTQSLNLAFQSHWAHCTRT
jgi:hypothetical protein